MIYLAALQAVQRVCSAFRKALRSPSNDATYGNVKLAVNPNNLDAFRSLTNWMEERSQG